MGDFAKTVKKLLRRPHQITGAAKAKSPAQEARSKAFRESFSGVKEGPKKKKRSVPKSRYRK